MPTLSSVPEENKLEEILAAVYIAGTENGLSKTITDPSEIMHRKEAFIKANPVCKEAIALINQQIKSVLNELEGIDVSETCVPECSDEQHAYHRGTYDAQEKLESTIQKIRSRYE